MKMGDTNLDVKIPIKNKIGYGMGEAGSQLSWALVSSYLSVYYTDVVGLTPAVISIIMLVARVWDAFNDPMFGSIAENTRTKWGRFRPYILWGAPILALFNCLTFLNLDISQGAKAFWCAFTYIGCGMAYTAVNISTGCVANSMTALNSERVTLNAFRNGVGQIAGVILSATAMPIILYFGDGSTSSAKGYFFAALIFSICSIPCFWICVASTKEIIGGGTRQKESHVVRELLTSFKLTFSDRNSRLVMIAIILCLTGLGGRLGVISYFFVYVINNPAMMAVYMTAFSVGMVLVNFYIPVLFNHVDKKICGIITCVLQAACCIATYFLGTSGNYIVITVLGFLFGFTHFCGNVAFTLAGEIIDDNWLRTGTRADGVIYSSISFGTKFGNAIGGSVGILLLGIVGFVANTNISAAVLTKMNAVINFVSAIFYLAAIIPFAMIRMTNKLGKENELKIKEMTARQENK